MRRARLLHRVAGLPRDSAGSLFRSVVGRFRRLLGHGLTGLVIVWAGAASGLPPATFVKQADRLIDARGLTLAFESTYGVMINGGVSGNDVIVSANGHQYAAYYVQSAAGRHVAVARRRAPSPTSAGGAWEVADLTTATLDNGLRGGVPWNSHCAIGLGVDLDNDKIHLAWDMHNDTLRYRATPAGVASAAPPAWSANLFGPETARMGGETLTGVTYPNFARDAGGSLSFFYRTGTSSTGIWHVRDYDGVSLPPSWSGSFNYDTTTGVDPATGSTSRTSYPNGFSFDDGNRLHMTFVWRENVAGGGDGTNHDLGYAYSDDRGFTWRNNAGQVVASQATGQKIGIDSPGLVVRPIPQGNGLMNTQGQAVDASGRIHAVMYHRDTAKSAAEVSTFTPAASSYFHYWRDGLGNWHRSQLPGDCTGARPRLYFDPADNAVAVLADGSLRVYAATKASNWTDWTLVASEPNYLSDAAADGDLFRKTGVLSLFEQRPPAANLALSEVRSLDFVPTFHAPLRQVFAAADGLWERSIWSGSGLPGSSSLAVIDHGRRAWLADGAGLVEVHSLGLGTAAGTGALVVTGGTLRVARTLAVGREGNGQGSYEQYGGSVRTDRFVVGEFTSETSGGGPSSAIIRGGGLDLRELAIGTAAAGAASGSSFTVAGGAVNVGGEIILGDFGSTATLEVSGGLLTVAGDVGRGVNGRNQATLRLIGGRLDATGNAVRVDRLVLGGGDLRNAAAVSFSTVEFAAPPGAASFSGTPALAGLSNTGGTWSIAAGGPLAGAMLEVATPVVLAAASAARGSDIDVRPGGELRITPGVAANAGRVTLSGGMLSATTLSVSAAPGAGLSALVINGGRVDGLPVLSVRDGGRVSLSSAVSGELAVSGLAIASEPGGGLIDLGTGRLSIGPAGVDSAGLRAAIIAGRNGGGWDGTAGITSSLATSGLGVGYVVAADGRAMASLAAPGDVGLDGSVDIFDLVAIDSAGRYGTGAAADWSQGDFDYDGRATVFDLVAVSGAGWFGQGSYLPPPVAPLVAAVPEPSAWGGALLGIAGLWLARLARR